MIQPAQIHDKALKETHKKMKRVVKDLKGKQNFYNTFYLCCLFHIIFIKFVRN